MNVVQTLPGNVNVPPSMTEGPRVNGPINVFLPQPTAGILSGLLNLPGTPTNKPPGPPSPGGVPLNVARFIGSVATSFSGQITNTKLGNFDNSTYYYNPSTLVPVQLPTVIPVSRLPVNNTTYQPVLLGTSERGMTIVIRKSRRPINTSASPDLADDLAHTGEEAMISGRLNVYDEQVYAALCSGPGNLLPRGTQGILDNGKLMVRQLCAHILYLYFPYASKNQMGGPLGRVVGVGQWADFVNTTGIGGRGSGTPTANTQGAQMPEGYRFLNCSLVAPEKLSAGSAAKHIDLAWHAIKDYPQRNPANYGFYDETYAQRLYDHNMRDLLRVGSPGAYWPGKYWN
jgi:hypothetical protein